MASTSAPRQAFRRRVHELGEGVADLAARAGAGRPSRSPACRPTRRRRWRRLRRGGARCPPTHVPQASTYTTLASVACDRRTASSSSSSASTQLADGRPSGRVLVAVDDDHAAQIVDQDLGDDGLPTWDACARTAAQDGEQSRRTRDVPRPRVRAAGRARPGRCRGGLARDLRRGRLSTAIRSSTRTKASTMRGVELRAAAALAARRDTGV